MRIKRATFVTSLTGNQRFEGEGLPQIAIAGKSNVGKSSLINCLCNQNKLARVSAEPGKTRLVNIFRINDDFHLVDLPGYGYARVSRSMQEDWGQMMDSYLSGSEHLCHILHLVDIRHDPGQHDLQMQAWIQHNQLPCTVIAVDDKFVTIDQNHPLAGHDLTFEVEILKIEDAPEDFVSEADRRKERERLTGMLSNGF